MSPELYPRSTNLDLQNSSSFNRTWVVQQLQVTSKPLQTLKILGKLLFTTTLIPVFFFFFAFLFLFFYITILYINFNQYIFILYIKRHECVLKGRYIKWIILIEFNHSQKGRLIMMVLQTRCDLLTVDWKGQAIGRAYILRYVSKIKNMTLCSGLLQQA